MIQSRCERIKDRIQWKLILFLNKAIQEFRFSERISNIKQILQTIFFIYTRRVELFNEDIHKFDLIILINCNYIEIKQFAKTQKTMTKIIEKQWLLQLGQYYEP